MCRCPISRSVTLLLTGLALGCAASFSAGCAAYTTPGRGVELTTFSSDADINERLARQPTAQFPARLAIARIQAPGYRSQSNEGYGAGRYSLVTTRDIEKDEDFARLQRLPQVAGVAPLNRLLVSPNLQSDKELRLAAASLKADVLLIYTLDTTFRIDNHEVGPLQLFALGFLPNQEACVTTTASAVLFDVRSSYVYGVAESTAKEKQLASVWTSGDAVEDSRLRAEGKAFQQMLGEVEIAWKKVSEEYGVKKAAADDTGQKVGLAADTAATMGK